MGVLEGKTAIVTGGARGLGEAAAAAFVREGASVVITDILQDVGEATAQRLGANCRFMVHDVRREAEWRDVVAFAEATFGFVSILVNNAGVVNLSPIEDYAEEDYRRVIDINQIGTFLGMKSVIGSMKQAKGGAIINISSFSGLRAVPHSLAYTASKFAVRGMTKVAALEFIEHGVRVNSIHPGAFRTKMGSLSDDPGQREAIQEAMQSVPAKREGEPAELAEMITLLASDKIPIATGAEFVLDGGMSCR